jgi:hypothetical protein
MVITRLVEAAASDKGGTFRGDGIDRRLCEEQRGKYDISRAGIVSGGSPRR